MEFITGSGIMLIELYRNKLGREEPALILFRDKYKNLYADAGGHLIPGLNVIESATEELKEESCNLFRIHPVYLQNYVVHNQYLGFAVYIRGPQKLGRYPIYSKYYKRNNILLNYHPMTPPSFKETNGMKRFYISDLINCGALNVSGDLHCYDADGIPQIIFGRTKGLLREMVRTGLINIVNGVYINLPIIELKIKKGFMAKDSHRQFLNGTTVYYAE